MSEPIEVLDSATVWYYEGEDADIKCRSENVKIEIYPNWICVLNPTSHYLPRERVEQITR